MPNLLEEIKQDILSDTPISTILRKAKILAYSLNSPELKEWVEYELNGYPNVDFIPDYRKFQGVPVGDFVSPGAHVKGVAIPMLRLPDWIQDFAKINLTMSAAQVEALKTSQSLQQSRDKIKPLVYPWPGDLLPLLYDKVLPNAGCLGARTEFPVGAADHVLDAIRNKLLSFVLELETRYPDLEVHGLSRGQVVPREAVRQLVAYNIYGGSHNIGTEGEARSQGGNMTTFNQQNQQVNTQYNAGNDINFGAVSSREELVPALEQLKAQIDLAVGEGVLDEELATDATYEVTKAIQQSKKAEPEKQTIIGHLKNAKSVVEGVTAAAGLATSLQKAIEAASNLF